MSQAISIIRNHWILGWLQGLQQQQQQQQRLVVSFAQLAVCKWQAKPPYSKMPWLPKNKKPKKSSPTAKIPLGGRPGCAVGVFEIVQKWKCCHFVHWITFIWWLADGQVGGWASGRRPCDSLIIRRNDCDCDCHRGDGQQQCLPHDRCSGVPGDKQGDYDTAPGPWPLARVNGLQICSAPCQRSRKKAAGIRKRNVI